MDGTCANFPEKIYAQPKDRPRFGNCKTRNHQPFKKNYMLNWAITFLVIALIAAVLGFGGLAGTAVGLAKILFFVFIVLFIASFLMGRKTPRV